MYKLFSQSKSNIVPKDNIDDDFRLWVPKFCCCNEDQEDCVCCNKWNMYSNMTSFTTEICSDIKGRNFGHVRCRCDNGQAVKGPKCKYNGMHICKRCDEGYSLVGQKCKGKSYWKICGIDSF